MVKLMEIIYDKKKNWQTSKGEAKKTKQKKSPDFPRCELCEKRGKLTKTECCDQWICDDEDKYVLFSYSRNSCHRNHRRYTLCGYHYNEGHDGNDWQSCQKCRESFETEMYVWYGTNEYNFEKLKDIPPYEPTRCAKCNTIIKLAEDGYSRKGGEYYCYDCSDIPY